MADMGKTEVDATVQETVSAIIQDQLINTFSFVSYDDTEIVF